MYGVMVFAQYFYQIQLPLQKKKTPKTGVVLHREEYFVCSNLTFLTNPWFVCLPKFVQDCKLWLDFYLYFMDSRVIDSSWNGVWKTFQFKVPRPRGNLDRKITCIRKSITSFYFHRSLKVVYIFEKWHFCTFKETK